MENNCNFVASCCSPSQFKDEFETFAKSLKLSLDKFSVNNPFLSALLGNFNAKSELLYKKDKTTNEGLQLTA